jgi:DNA-binding PadR family transcriptional regulator
MMFEHRNTNHQGRRFAHSRREFTGSAIHGRHGRHGGSRRGRVFEHGELRLVILQLVAEKPRHGYEIIKDIEERLGGSYSPSPGVVYPTLTLLEELGYATVATSGDDTKKLYAITEEGTQYLQKNKEAVNVVFGRMAETGSSHAGNPPAPIVRALENLSLAVRLRLSGTPLTEDQIRAVAAAIDAAAVTVEQI